MSTITAPLASCTVLLPGEDPDHYQQHVDRFFAEHQPADESEAELVQALADIQWRLKRIPELETGIYHLGHLQLSEQFAQQYPDLDSAALARLIRTQVYLTHVKELSNLALQESRLQRRFDKLLREFQERKAIRLQNEQLALQEAARLYLEAQNANKPFDPAQFGFEFSISEIEDFLTKPRTQKLPRAA